VGATFNKGNHVEVKHCLTKLSFSPNTDCPVPPQVNTAAWQKSLAIYLFGDEALGGPEKDLTN